MDETTLRLVLIGSSLAVALGVVGVLRSRGDRRVRRLRVASLDPGVYLFTSATCAECEPARRRMVELRGEGGYVELGWEGRPELFTELGVDQVPSTLVVGGDGRARLYPGVPARLVDIVDP